MSVLSTIRKGATAVRSYYAVQKKEAEKRAKRRMKAARTKYERERIKAELEMEKLKLQRSMYDAQAAVRREKEAVARARDAARGSSGGSLSRGLAKGWKALNAFYVGKPKSRSRRKSVVRRGAARTR